MRWFIAAFAFTVIFAIFGSTAALVLGWPLKHVRSDRQVVSLNGKGSGPAVSDKSQPSSLKRAM